MTALALTAALSAGLAGSVHCAAMCGGIATAFGVRQTVAGARAAAGAIGFNLGRVLGYSLAGGALQVAVSTAGAAVPGAGYGRGMRLLAALWLTALAARLLTGTDLLRMGAVGTWCWRRLAPLAGTVMRWPPLPRVLALGMLWGFMPCGLVYSLLLVASAAPSPTAAMGVMAAFGLGTMPALLGIGTGAAFGLGLLPVSAPALRRAAGVVVLGCGLATGWGALSSSHHHHPGQGDSGHSTAATAP